MRPRRPDFLYSTESDCCLAGVGSKAHHVRCARTNTLGSGIYSLWRNRGEGESERQISRAKYNKGRVTAPSLPTAIYKLCMGCLVSINDKMAQISASPPSPVHRPPTTLPPGRLNLLLAHFYRNSFGGGGGGPGLEEGIILDPSRSVLLGLHEICMYV